MTMHIRAQEVNMMKSYTLPFANQNKTDKAQRQEEGLVVSASEMKSRQNQTKQDYIESLYKQVEQLQESIQKVQENEKLSREAKAEQLEQIRKEIQELEQQIVKVQEQEREEQLKEEEEKREEEEAKRLTPEEREKKVQEAQQKMLAGIAGAMNKIEEATPSYNKVKEYTTKGQLGMGSKYKGNLSVVEVESLFSKAAQYGREMMNSLKEAQQNAYSVGKAAATYQKYKNQVEQEKQENKETISE